jgi:hypothetical protein
MPTMTRDGDNVPTARFKKTNAAMMSIDMDPVNLPVASKPRSAEIDPRNHAIVGLQCPWNTLMFKEQVRNNFPICPWHSAGRDARRLSNHSPKTDPEVISVPFLSSYALRRCSIFFRDSGSGAAFN